MYAFVVGDFFRRRRRGPRYERDEMPEWPLVQVILMWLLLGIGGLSAAFAIATLILDLGVAIAIACAAVAVACFWAAMKMWWVMTR